MSDPQQRAFSLILSIQADTHEEIILFLNYLSTDLQRGATLVKFNADTVGYTLEFLKDPKLDHSTEFQTLDKQLDDAIKASK